MRVRGILNDCRNDPGIDRIADPIAQQLQLSVDERQRDTLTELSIECRERERELLENIGCRK
jgi:hypothetical protein